MSRFKRILVPIDFSAHSTAAFEAAVEIAKAFDSKIHLLHCYPIQPGGISPYGIAIPSSYFSEIRDAASQQLAEWQEKHAPTGVSVDASTMSESRLLSRVHAFRTSQSATSQSRSIVQRCSYGIDFSTPKTDSMNDQK